MAILDSQVTHVSKCTAFPDHPSSPENHKLTVSDLPILSCHYIQKGVLFTRPPFPVDTLLGLLKRGLSQTLTHFPALAGRLSTDSGGVVYNDCNDFGVDFFHANAGKLTLRDVLSPDYVLDVVKDFFTFDSTGSYDGHFKPLVAVQVTELAGGVFIACSVNHAVSEGTSFWNFFNTWTEICKGVKRSAIKPSSLCKNLRFFVVSSTTVGGGCFMEKQFEEFRLQLDESGSVRERIRAVTMEMDSATRLMLSSLLLVHLVAMARIRRVVWRRSGVGAVGGRWRNGGAPPLLKRRTGV